LVKKTTERTYELDLKGSECHFRRSLFYIDPGFPGCDGQIVPECNEAEGLKFCTVRVDSGEVSLQDCGASSISISRKKGKITLKLDKELDIRIGTTNDLVKIALGLKKRGDLMHLKPGAIEWIMQGECLDPSSENLKSSVVNTDEPLMLPRWAVKKIKEINSSKK